MASPMCGPLFNITHSRPGAHRRVRDLRSRRQSILRQRLEQLRCPDDRHLRRLGQPEDLFLHLGETFETDFDTEIAASDHHRDPPPLRRRHQQLREAFESDAILDLQNHAEIRCVQLLEHLVETVDIGGARERRRAPPGRRDARRTRDPPGPCRSAPADRAGVRQVDAFLGFERGAAARRRAGSRR